MCNSVANTYYGVLFQGHNYITDFRGTSIQDHFEGLYLDATAIIDPQNHTGNRWFGIYGLRGATCAGIPGSSAFTVNPVDAFATPPSFTPGLFLSSQNGNGTDCPNYTGHNEPYCGYMERNGEEGEKDITYYDLQVAAGDVPVAEFEEETNYMADKSLYKKLNDDETLIDNSVLQDFYDDAATSNIGYQREIKNSIESINSISETLMMTLRNIDSTIVLYQDSMAVNDSIIALNQNAASIQANTLMKAAIYSMSAFRDSVNDVLDSLKRIDAQNIEADNAVIQTSQVIQNNEKIVNHYLMDKIAQHDFDFSAAEVTEIFGVAIQCPKSGGKAVFTAQGIYRMIDDGYVFDNESACAAEGYRRAHPSSTINQFSFIKPNPTSDKAVLTYTNIKGDNLRVRVYNAMNEELYSTSLNPEQLEHTFEVSNFNNGIYYYTIVSDEKIVSSGKFAVIR